MGSRVAVPRVCSEAEPGCSYGRLCQLFWHLCICPLVLLGTVPGALFTPGEHLTTDTHPQPVSFFTLRQGLGVAGGLAYN